jgi:trehalose synthase
VSYLTHVDIGALRPERFEEILSEELYSKFGATILEARETLAGRVVWNVNSTARGGGVAEMLASLLAYARGAGVDARWTVIRGNEGFFAVTKRIHNHLHGAPGDGGELGDEARRIYEDALAPNAAEFADLVAKDDIVLLHDPQTAGLAARLKETGATVIWRCHVGIDDPNEIAKGAWEFLLPYVEPADAYIFSRPDFSWEGLSDDKVEIIPPSIDAFSPKNQELDPATVDAILATTKMVDAEPAATPSYFRVDGTVDVVARTTDMYGAPPPPPSVPLVVQVSRWDALKDPLGVMHGFVEHVSHDTGAHLVLAGPSVEAVADDPEGAQVLQQTADAWASLPEEERARVHLACMPMDDGAENAAIVNAIQRKATVVVQKSIAEGFGLTVAEGMWKARPVVATRIGGIQDQIEHGVSGMLIDDPHDLAAYGAAVSELLKDPARAQTMGTSAKERVREDFLGPRHLIQYMDLMRKLIA